MRNNKNFELLNQYLNNYSKEQTKYFIRFLAKHYLDNFTLHDLTGSLNCLVREIDDTIPDSDLDSRFDELIKKNPYYFLDYLSQEVIVDTLTIYIEEHDVSMFLYVAQAISGVY